MSETQSESVILLVEDDTSLRNLMQSLLNDLFGVQTVAAADGEEALRLVREKNPSLILLDIMLPGMDGLAVARELKSQPETQHIPIVAVTATKMRDKALEAGCAEYVQKPFDMDYFIERVQGYLSKQVELVCL